MNPRSPSHLRWAFVAAAISGSLLWIAGTAVASDTSTRWESFSEATACGEPYTRTPTMSKTGVISSSEPILGPFGTYFGRSVGQVRTELVYWTVPGSGGVRVQVHRAALPAFQQVTAGLAAQAAAGRVYRVTRVSSFFGRTLSGSHQLSRHALGTAIDINYPQNPYRSDGRLITNMPDWFVQVWRDAGFCWGGDWVNAKDPMHFSWIGPRTTADAGDDMAPRPPSTSARPFGAVNASHPTVFGPVLDRYVFAVADATGSGAPDVVGLRSHPTGAVMDIATGARVFGSCSIQRWHIPDGSVLGADHTLFIDVDGDSRQDLVTITAGSPVNALVATRRGGYDDVTPRTTSLPSDLVAVAGADFDADHRADLWAVTSDGTLQVLGGDTWSDPLHTSSLPSGAPSRLAVSDRDGGNLPEIFALYPNGGGARIEVLRLTGGAWVVEQTVAVPRAAEDVLSFAGGDYDGDGRADLQTLDSTGRLDVYLGNTSTGRPPAAWFTLRNPDCDDPIPLLFEGTFYDDEGSVHRNGIEAIAAAGITAGCNPPFNDRFCPGDVLTRAQAATFLSRASSLPEPSRDYFDDDNGHVLEGGINRVAEAGITMGCNPPANTRFCPDRRMTRAEFATFIVRALSLPATDTDYFTDDNGHVLEGAINRLAEAGITKGCNPPANDRFCPQSLLTRAETATFMTRAFRLTG
jgi:D-alanyl-D-alanine carboxypeptidase/FG-GAP-like repeat